MKGAGETCFETDFPPGSDMMGEIMSGPKAAARMEYELCGRLKPLRVAVETKLGRHVICT